MKTTNTMNRREMIAASVTAAASVMIVPRHVLGGPGQKAPSEKLNIAGIGIGGMGSGDTQSCGGSENIVALCDVDQGALERMGKKFPNAKQFADFRKMLEEQKDIDVVFIATPDHCHAVATMMALKMGKHVHCQKPLTHSVYEARMIGKAAAEAKVATQMGNFGQAGEEARLVCEYIQSGMIGTVREIHGGSNRPGGISPRGIPRPKDKPPCPPKLNWDLWLGPSPERPYHPCYHPFAWRGWWDFGTGCLGDIGCHEFSKVFKALKLGHPAWVEACSSNHSLGKEIANESAPLASITRWYFPKEGDREALMLYWWDGGLRPQRPEELEPDREFGENDWTYIVGDKAKIYGHRIIPESKQKEIGRPPRTLERSPGHWQEFFAACRGGKPAGADFAKHSAHLAEVVLLGNIALRTPGRLMWDAENLKFTNNEKANALINPPYRQGYSL
ncbi:MAG: Gfo/Idh/MocA family oxidoreductase [Planctomycetota bacterium]|nr:Gfo/Idh/MocA family oxidoreductase [Planctomycetota bacterium]